MSRRNERGSGLVSTALAELRSDRRRSRTLVVTVALGTALLTAALVLGATLQDAVSRATGVQFEGADLVVQTGPQPEELRALGPSGSARSPAGLTDRHLDRLAEVDGVAEASGMVSIRAVAQVEGVTRGLLLESRPESVGMQWQGLSRGRMPADDDEVALTRLALDELGIDVGDEVALSRSDFPRALFTVVGEVDPRGSVWHTSTDYGIVTADRAREMADLSGDNIALVALEDDADTSEVIEAIDGSAVGWPRAADDIAGASVGDRGERLQSSGAVVTGFAVGAFVVAALLLAAVTSIGLAARRRTNALLRMNGATRGDLVRLGLAEAVAIGLIGAVLGVLGGIALAAAVAPVMSFVPLLPSLHPAAFTVPTRAVVLPVLAALLLTSAAGVLPALVAGRESPSAAMRSATTATPQRGPLHWILPLALLVIGAVLALVGGSALVVGLACALLLIGALFALPLLIRLVARSVLRTKPVRSDPARSLAVGWLVDQPGRAAGEVVALALACAMVAFTWVGVGSLQESSSGRLADASTADIVLGSTDSTPMSARAFADLAGVPGVRAVTPLAVGPDVTVEGRDGSSSVVFSGGTVAAEIEALDDVLGEPFVLREVAADTVYLPAADEALFPDGATVTVRGPFGSRPNLTVAHVEGLPVPSMVAPEVLQAVSVGTEDRIAWLALDAGVDREQVLAEVTGVALLDEDVTVGGAIPEDLRVGGTIETARAAVTGLLALAVLLVVGGVVVAGAHSVRERDGEHALLRALGVERPSMHRLLMMRLLVVGAVGAGVGLVTGAVLGILVSRAIIEGMGLVPQVVVPWLPALVVAVLVCLMVRMACVLPMERASLARPARALAVNG